MSIDSLVRYVARCCARQGVSLYTLADKHDWPAEEVTEFARAHKPPTDRMLRDMARDLDIAPDSLQRSLNE